MFYVYAHYFSGEPHPFYVGKGTKDRAFQYGKRRSLFWNRIVEKYSQTKTLEVKYLAKNIKSEQEAYNIETFWITVLGRRNNNTGCLSNLTDGGAGGCSGRILSEETKQKIGNRNKGKIRTEKFKQHIREKHIGMKASLETKEKMSKVRGSKPVLLISNAGIMELVTNQYEFARKHSCSHGNINQMIHGKRKTVNGWRLYSPNTLEGTCS